MSEDERRSVNFSKRELWGFMVFMFLVILYTCLAGIPMLTYKAGDRSCDTRYVGYAAYGPWLSCIHNVSWTSPVLIGLFITGIVMLMAIPPLFYWAGSTSREKTLKILRIIAPATLVVFGLVAITFFIVLMNSPFA